MAQDIPKTMKQWTVSGSDGFDSLKFSHVPVPTPGDGEVLSAVLL
ncbi:hypothetical protein GMORB2_5470 [Geosmithia morbida]|uniref:Uncharacterized protein n=1 Tax=Geosmithia morbida TaxID=1094350 RepID=A0A9P4YNP6_9HYPO|nr:uncharacterized protein GMORB2_5470 [Geosmithia morbida]KAF4119245.1 hypothetical protein GMORB2_5470 [Geosmithia morbida]